MTAGHKAIVVFELLQDSTWRHHDRSKRAELLRHEVKQRMQHVLEDLAGVGMADEVTVLDATSGQRVPTGAVMVCASAKALQVIREAKGVAAVAEVDTPLPVDRFRQRSGQPSPGEAGDSPLATASVRINP